MNTFYQKLKPYLPKNKDKRINVLVLQPGQKFDYTGTSPDGKVRPDKPTEMVSTSQGPLMLHQGEGKITNPDGTVNVIPAHQLATLEKEHNIPGMELGGVYNLENPLHVSIPGLGQSTLQVQQTNQMQSGSKSAPVISRPTTGSNSNLNTGSETGFGGTGFGLENPLHVSIPGLGNSTYNSAPTIQRPTTTIPKSPTLQSLKGAATGGGRQDAGGPGEKTAAATGANTNEIAKKMAMINPPQTQGTGSTGSTGNTGAAHGTGQYYQNLGLASMLQTSQGLNPNDRKLLNMYMQNYDASTAAGNAELISRISADPNLTPEGRNMALFSLNRNANIGRSTLEGTLATNSMQRMDAAKSALYSAGKDLQATADTKTQQDFTWLMDNVNNRIKSGDIDGAKAQWAAMKNDPKYAQFFQDLQEPNWTKLQTDANVSTTGDIPLDKLTDNWIKEYAPAYGDKIGATVDGSGNITVTDQTKYAKFRKDMITCLAYAKTESIVHIDKDGNMVVASGSHFDLPWENPDTMFDFVDWGGKDLAPGQTINDVGGTNVTGADGKNVTYTKADGTTANLTYADLTKVWNGMSTDQRNEYVDHSTGQVLISKFIKDYSKITNANISSLAPKGTMSITDYQTYILSTDGAEAWGKYVTANGASINNVSLDYIDSNGNQQTLKYGDKNFKYVWGQLNQAYPGITDISAYNGKLQINSDGTISNFGDNYTPPDGYERDPNTHQLTWVGSSTTKLADFKLTKTLSFADKKEYYDRKPAGTKVAIRYDNNAYNNRGKIIQLGQYSFTLVDIDGGEIGSQTITIKDSSGRNGTMACYKVDNSHFKWTITWADGSQPTDIVVDMSIASQT